MPIPVCPGTFLFGVRRVDKCYPTPDALQELSAGGTTSRGHFSSNCLDHRLDSNVDRIIASFASRSHHSRSSKRRACVLSLGSRHLLTVILCHSFRTDTPKLHTPSFRPACRYRFIFHSITQQVIFMVLICMFNAKPSSAYLRGVSCLWLSSQRQG